jgi:hypothetical protein
MRTSSAFSSGVNCGIADDMSRPPARFAINKKKPITEAASMGAKIC